MMIRSRTPDANGDFAQRPIQPSDIAILTRSNSEASIVAADLAAAGIPAATASSQSVLDSEAAFQWQILLEAIGKPGSVGLAKAAALGWFFGLDSQAVDALDDVGIAGLQDRLRDWGRLLQERGLSALVHRARSEGVQARLLRGPTGERDLTDLDHVAEVLQSVSGGRPATAGVLLALLAEAASQSDDEGLAKDFLARRIDRDDHAVSVLTVHKSKGLEYPILLLPFMWTDSSRTRGLPHGVSSGVRYLDGTWIPDLKPTKLNEELRNQNRDEVAGEARRLLYVAMTRARHRCVIWWPEGTVKSPLADLFEHRLGSPAVDLSDLDPLVESSQGRISVVPVSIFTKAPSSVEGTLLDPALSVSEQADQSILGIRETTRVLDNSWRIWSFTGIVSAARARSSSVGIADVAHRIAEKTELMLGSGTDEAVLSDLLPADLSSTDLSSTDLSALGMPPEDLGFDNPEQETLELRSAPAGTVFGTLVHEVLEVVDFAAEDLVEQLQTECARRLLYRPMDITAERLATGLAQAVRAPLGGPLGMRRLVDLPRSDRVDEMDFFLPLGKITASDIGKVLVDHLAPDDPLLSWAQSLAGRDGETTGFDLDLQGRLTGSIDLTMRWMDPVNGQMRYWVADYKSNRLSEPATYRGPELFEAMVHHDYPLQAILYLVACHRYLRWKLPDYEPAQHLGGAAYLFLRGMDPRSVPDDVPDDAPGVAWWTPGAEAVCAVDELLARGAGHRGAEQS
jgi:exodeoxyribonuclease V beta subunit